MLLSKMKKIWDYTTYNKPFFLLIFALFFILEYIADIYSDLTHIIPLLITSIIGMVVCGYGMVICRDKINNGSRLPKIIVKDIFIYGIFSFLVYVFYLMVQGYILDFISSLMHFPEFDLEDMLLELPKTINTLFSHNPVNALTFVIVGSILFYITTFFIEIALARLADTGSIISAFNIKGILTDINIIGWKDYGKEFSIIFLLMVFFAALKYIVIPVDILDNIWDVLLDLFIFITQFWGIGNIYSIIKEKKKIINGNC